MKRTCVSGFVFLALAVSFSGCATLKEMGRIAGATAVAEVSRARDGIEINVKQFGFQVPPHSRVIVNNTPFYLRLIVYDRIVGSLGPCTVGYNKEYVEPLAPQIPLLAKVYRDPEYTAWIGFAWTAIQVPQWGNQAFSWPIGIYDIRTPDGQPLFGGYGFSVYPEPDCDFTSKWLEFPREPQNSVAGVQFVNNTLFVAHPHVNGYPLDDVLPGGMAYIRGQSSIFSTYPQEAALKVIFEDRGRRVGVVDYFFAVPRGAIWAYQFVPGPFDIQR